eukprot:GFUD01009351.1.p1 GENE.GFUD01009351.1~~GFUD01009351.1.p1  ORF type:complete len:433 (+),score=108.51 GFUD01009351.1:210-1508(+)
MKALLWSCLLLSLSGLQAQANSREDVLDYLTRIITTYLSSDSTLVTMRQKVNLLPALINRQAVRFFDTVDLDKDEDLDRKEIRIKAQHLLVLAFNTLDADGDGVLRSPEEALTRFKTKVFDQFLGEVFPTFAGEDDKLGPKDLTRYWKSLPIEFAVLSKTSSWPELLDILDTIPPPNRTEGTAIEEQRMKDLDQQLERIIYTLVEKIDVDMDGQFYKQELANFLFIVFNKFDENKDEIVEIDELINVANSIGILDEANMKRDKIEYEILVSKTIPFFKSFLKLVDDSDEQLTKAEVLKILDVNVNELYEALDKNVQIFLTDWDTFVGRLKPPLLSSKTSDEALTSWELVMTFAEGRILGQTNEKPKGPLLVICVIGLVVFLGLVIALGICLYRRSGRRTTQANEEPRQTIEEVDAVRKDDVYYSEDDYYSEL